MFLSYPFFLPTAEICHFYIKSQSKSEISPKSKQITNSQMASIAQFHALFPAKSIKRSSSNGGNAFLGSAISSRRAVQKTRERKQLTVVAAVGDVSSDGTAYLIAGAAAVALLGTAFPILFSRKDTLEYKISFSLILEIRSR